MRGKTHFLHKAHAAVTGAFGAAWTALAALVRVFAVPVRGVAGAVSAAVRRLGAWRAGLRFARYVAWRHAYDAAGRRIQLVALARRRRAAAAWSTMRSQGAMQAGVGRRVAMIGLMLMLGSAGLATHSTPAPQTPVDEVSALAMMEDRFDDRPLNLVPATRVPVAAPPALASQRLAPRETYAFAPWWTLENAPKFDLRGLTTIAYFGVDVAGNGALIREGNGWTGYESQVFADLISRAHAAGIRVVLTAKTFVAKDLRKLSTNRNAARRLAAELIPVLRAKNLDGVNFDFEGFGGDVQKEFPKFIKTVSNALHATNPAWQVTIDTYVSSSEVTPDSFFDIPALAPSVDAFFVMGYDMYRTGIASPNAPLPRYESAIRDYLKMVPASKLILGTPFYGYDWPTVDNSPHSRAVGPKTPIPYADIVRAGWPRYWDPVAQSPWTAYKVGNQWHEVYYDDPSSLALKARLAQQHRLRGVGAWALGMEGAEREMIDALLGKITSIVAGPAAPAIIAGPQPSPRPSASTRPPSSSPKPKPKPKPSASPSPSESPLPLPVPTGL